MNGSDARHNDDHQEDQDDQECPQECPPSSRIFLMALIATNTHVSYIFGMLLNGSDARHHDDHQEDQECPQGMGMFLMTTGLLTLLEAY